MYFAEKKIEKTNLDLLMCISKNDRGALNVTDWSVTLSFFDAFPNKSHVFVLYFLLEV